MSFPSVRRALVIVSTAIAGLPLAGTGAAHAETTYYEIVAAQTSGLTGADLEVFYVNGDYTDRTPKIMRYEMNFTPNDLVENWAGIVSTAEENSWL